MNPKIKLSIVAVVSVFLAWFAAAPFIAVHGMKSAVEARDSARLSSYINFPAVRESVKASFMASLAEMAAQTKNEQFSGVGTAFAAMMVGPLVDTMISPEGLAEIFAGQKTEPGKTPPAERRSEAKKPGEEVERTMRYESFNRFVVSIKDKQAQSEPIALVLERDGLFSWKLTSMRMQGLLKPR